eukprot:gene6163-6401_t
MILQVEALRQPGLAGLPMAVRQHADVIAVNYPARQAGVKKHMTPSKASAILSAAGGVLAHVFTEPDGRVSYRPYREASAALMRLLRVGGDTAAAAAAASSRSSHHSRGPSAAGCFGVGGVTLLVVEKASIDEAFLLLGLQELLGPVDVRGPPVSQTASLQPPDMAAWVAAAGPAGTCWDLAAAAAVAAAVRAAVKGALGLNVSVGVAPNKLLAKLASRAAKPDGVKVLDSVAAVQQLLQGTPVDRLPGILPPPPAAAAKLAVRLSQWGWGCDLTPVADRGPPKSIQPDTFPRLAAVLAALTDDLLGRVMLDRHSEDRWPGKLALTMATVLLAPVAPGQVVCQLNLSASNFGPFEAAAAAGSITRFTTKVAAPRAAAV